MNFSLTQFDYIHEPLKHSSHRPSTDWLPADMASDYILAPCSDLFPAGCLIPLFIVRIPDAIHMFKNGELLASRLGFGGGIQPVTGMWWADFVTGGLFQFARLHAGSHLYRNLARQVSMLIHVLTCLHCVQHPSQHIQALKVGLC